MVKKIMQVFGLAYGLLFIYLVVKIMAINISHADLTPMQILGTYWLDYLELVLCLAAIIGTQRALHTEGASNL